MFSSQIARPWHALLNACINLLEKNDIQIQNNKNSDRFSKCFQCYILEFMNQVIDVFVNGIISYMEAIIVILIQWI